MALIIGCSSDEEAATATSAPQPTATTEATTEPTKEAETYVPASSLELKDVPRNRTLVFTHWSDRYRTQHDNVENFNWWLPGNGHAREAMDKGLMEQLFYTNLNTGELIPWQGESFEYNDTFDSIDVVLRDGVKWADGVPFTAHDVKFTLDMVIAASPDLNRSSLYADMIESVVVADDLHFTINLTRPEPRFFVQQFGQGHGSHTAMVAKHVWEGKDPLTFSNYDTEKGWPLGTGGFELVKSTPEVQIYDRRDNWWGEEIGFSEPAQVERLMYIPVADDDVAAQLYISNQLDYGPPLLKGTFEAAKNRNPSLRSWNKEGPVWGAPDGCNFVMILNNQKPPFDNVDVRWAINLGIDREELVTLAYEGGMPPVVVPISSYGASQYVPLMQDIIDKHDAAGFSLDRSAARMEKAGYSMDSGEYWTKDGEKIEITLEIPSWMRPMGPVLEKQLQTAGFDIVFKQGEPATIGDRLQMGETEVIWVQCGSINEPYDTFKSYHSKNSAPPGEVYAGAVQGGRYENAEMDAILDEMESMIHSPNNERYVELARGAMDLFLRDMPVIHLAEERHVIIQNENYWKGWPGVEDPYVAPYPPWNAHYLITLNLKATE